MDTAAKRHYHRNRERLLEERKQHRHENREYHNELQLKYSHTEKGKKARCKARWKNRGVDVSNFDEIYKRYSEATECELCNKKFTGKKGEKCLDHCHESKQVRNIVCRNCNVSLPKQQYIKKNSSNNINDTNL